MSTGINVTKPIKILDEGVLLTSDVSQIDFTGGVTATTSGNNVTVNVPAAGITVGTTPVTSGTDGRVFFQAGGVVQQDANFTFDNTLKRLTLKAVGTAATDIPFAIQNSGGTANILQATGIGTVWANGAGAITSNVTFGIEALDANTTGIQNSAYGYRSLSAVTTGERNTGLGAYTLYVNTGNENTAIGDEAMYANTTGVQNVAIGAGALDANIGGNANTVVGRGALGSLPTSTANTFMGWNSGFALTTATNNVAMGYEAARVFGTGGGTNLTSLTNSVFIGYDTRANANAQTNQIVIGYQALGLGSNTTVIGNSSTTLFRPYGNVAIGADSASARLDVRAQGALSTDIAFRVRNSADSHNLISVAGNNQVLVGWTNELGALSINGASKAATDVVFSALGLGSQQLFYGQNNGVVRFGANANRIEFDGTNWNVTNTGNVNWNISANKYFLIGQPAGIGSITIGTLTVLPKSTSASEYVTCLTNPTANGYFQRVSNTNVTDIFNATTAPSTNVTDAFRMYGADITAGNAAPHFRTENGAIVKVYQETTGVGASTLVGNAGTNITDTDTFDGYTLKQIVKALRNQGLLA